MIGDQNKAVLNWTWKVSALFKTQLHKNMILDTYLCTEPSPTASAPWITPLQVYWLIGLYPILNKEQL